MTIIETEQGDVNMRRQNEQPEQRLEPQLAEIVHDIFWFQQACEQREYTDTTEAWALLDRIAQTLSELIDPPPTHPSDRVAVWGREDVEEWRDEYEAWEKRQEARVRA
jgi:hypothetical protein